MSYNLVKLTNLAHVEHASSSRRNPSWLSAELTQEEISKLTPMAQQSTESISERAKYLVEGFPQERLEGLFSSEGLGYLPPDKVRKYYIGRYDREFEGGLFHQVVIDFEDEWQNGRVGTYTYWHPYQADKIPQGISPGQKGFKIDDSGHDVLSGPVLVDDEPATEYIVEDRAGKFVPISDKWIESLILEGRSNYANIGFISANRFIWPNLEKAKRLALATGRQDLIEIVDDAISYVGELVAQGPAIREEALRQGSIFTGTPRYQVELNGELHLSWQSGTGEYDTMQYRRKRRRGEGNVDPKLFPFSLESLSTQAVVELMKHFAGKEFDLDYIQKHMKIKQIG